MCSFPLSIQFTNCDRNQDSLSQKEMNKWGTRAAWWLVGYHQVSAIAILYGNKMEQGTGLKMEWDVNEGMFLLLILWFRLLASLLRLTPDFYFGKFDKRAQD